MKKRPASWTRKRAGRRWRKSSIMADSVGGGDAVIEASNEACRIASEVLRRGTSHPSDRGAWISVKDRLPKDRGNVLVVAFWHERWDVYMGWCAPKRSEWSVRVGLGDRNDVAVSHWMPLPEPPKED